MNNLNVPGVIALQTSEMQQIDGGELLTAFLYGAAVGGAFGVALVAGVVLVGVAASVM